MNPKAEKYDSLKAKLRFKYLLDRVSAFCCLIITSPLFFFAACLIKLDGFLHPRNRGSVFYKEPRMSEGRQFFIIKFRTIDESTVQWVREKPNVRSITGSPNTTWAGRWLLKWYLDELPQLWNVLKGEMSIVGPRPHILDQHQAEVNQGSVYRNYLKAGILGVPQACKRHPKYEALFKQMARAHKSENQALNSLDGLYARKCLENSLFGILLFDLSIIFKGLTVILTGDSVDSR